MGDENQEGWRDFALSAALNIADGQFGNACHIDDISGSPSEKAGQAIGLISSAFSTPSQHCLQDRERRAQEQADLAGASRLNLTMEPVVNMPDNLDFGETVYSRPAFGGRFEVQTDGESAGVRWSMPLGGNR